jgi:uncharacterized protein YggE
MKYLILAPMFFFYTSAWCQVSGNVNYQQPVIHNNVAAAETHDQEITLSVSGLLNAKADTYVAFFHVMQVAETAATADSLLKVRIDKFKTELKKSGVDTAAVHTDMISFVPKYDFNVINRLFSKTYNEVPDGFELQKNVIIRYEHASALDAIVTAAASAEIYDLVKVDYFLKDIKKYYDQLRLQCMEALKARMKSYESLGIKLDTLKKTLDEDFGTNLPQQRYGSYQAVARPSMAAVKKSVDGVSLKFRSVERSPSRYYQAVSYEEYDVVINSVIDQPMIQLTYQIKMKFFLNTKEPGAQNTLFFIGANGQLQKLDIKTP